MRLLVKRLHADVNLPTYKKSGDAGFDLHTVEEICIEPGCTAILPTGLSFAIPEGYEMQIRMRSGSALKTPIIVANAPGTIDSGYRGEVGIVVRNVGDTPYIVRKGERIAQGVIAPVIQAEFIECDNLPESDRGACGYGSTGMT